MIIVKYCKSQGKEGDVSLRQTHMNNKYFRYILKKIAHDYWFPLLVLGEQVLQKYILGPGTTSKSFVKLDPAKTGPDQQYC